MGGILFPEDVERFFEAILLDQAVSGQISARGVASDQVLFGEEALRARVIPCREMNLGKPECVLVVFCGLSVCDHQSEVRGHTS